MKNVLIIGYKGEVGSAIYSILKESKKYNLLKKDTEPLNIKEKVDVMHISIPYSDRFINIAAGYIRKYKPGLAIIHSTVRPGTTNKIYEKTKALIVHSPVRGRHPDLKGGIFKFIKFIGPANKKAALLAKEHLDSLGIKTEILKSPLETEVGKLLCTTYYAVHIAFHQDMDRICDRFGADFKQAVTRFNQTCTMDINHKIPRPVMFPGFIGGHCLIPNIEILKKDIKSDFLEDILKSNELTRKKLKIKKTKK